MYLLQLFHEANLENALYARVATEGITKVGRDPASDWIIDDPYNEISRNHFELQLSGGRLLLLPLGANGVFREGSAERLPDQELAPLAFGDRLRFGRYSILIGRCPFASTADALGDHTMISSRSSDDANPDFEQWVEGEELSVTTASESLLEAFCQGAKLDASAFSAQEPAEIMREVGAIYRQVVLGLASLMSDRLAIRLHSGLNRTTIGATDNNLFKWAPSQRLAVDLLIKKEAEFMSGASAVQASIQDLKQHMAATHAGCRAALQAVLEATKPESVRARVKRSSMLQSWDSAAWAAFQAVHAELESGLTGDLSGSISQAFSTGYDQAARDWQAKARQ